MNTLLEHQLQLISNQLTELKSQLGRTLKAIRAEQWLQAGALHTSAAMLADLGEPAPPQTIVQVLDPDIAIREQITFLVCKAPTSKPMKLHDLLTALSVLQTECDQKVWFSPKGVSAIVKEIFGVKAVKSNGHITYRGVSLAYRPFSEYSYGKVTFSQSSPYSAV